MAKSTVFSRPEGALGEQKVPEIVYVAIAFSVPPTGLNTVMLRFLRLYPVARSMTSKSSLNLVMLKIKFWEATVTGTL